MEQVTDPTTDDLVCPCCGLTPNSGRQELVLSQTASQLHVLFHQASGTLAGFPVDCFPCHFQGILADELAVYIYIYILMYFLLTYLHLYLYVCLCVGFLVEVYTYI